MKTIMIIDGADNCAYDCFLASEELFKAIFPEDGQDIEFIEDFLLRYPNGEFDSEFDEMWRRRVDKDKIKGINGTMFYGLVKKKVFYPNKRDSDLTVNKSRSRH